MLSDYNSETFIGYEGNNVVEVKLLKDIDVKSVDIYISDNLFMINSLFREISPP